MANECANSRYDKITVDGVPESLEEGSVSIVNPTGWEVEGVPATDGTSGSKYKRVTAGLKYKPMTNGQYSPQKYEPGSVHQLSFYDTLRDKRGRVSKATVAKHGELGSDNPEVEWIFNTPIQWL